MIEQPDRYGFYNPEGIGLDSTPKPMRSQSRTFNYSVEVKKTYYNEQNPDDTLTMTGVVSVSASSPSDAIALVTKMRLGGLQTCDPRIRWDMRRPISGWVYQDFSFVITGEFHNSAGKFYFNHNVGI